MSAGTQDLRDASADFIDAFNEADWSRFRSHLRDDALYQETGTGRQVKGADSYVELCQGWRRALPDCRGTILRAITDGALVAQEVRWEGTHTGPLETPAGTLQATGRPIDVRASIWIGFDGDHIADVHHHLDVLSLLDQVDALQSPTGA